MSLIKWSNLCTDYNIKHIMGIPHNPTGQPGRERSNSTLKGMLNKLKGVRRTPRDRLYKCFINFNFLNANEAWTVTAERYWIIGKKCWIRSACIL